MAFSDFGTPGNVVRTAVAARLLPTTLKIPSVPKIGPESTQDQPRIDPEPSQNQARIDPEPLGIPPGGFPWGVPPRGHPEGPPRETPRTAQSTDLRCFCRLTAQVARGLRKWLIARSAAPLMGAADRAINYLCSLRRLIVIFKILSIRPRPTVLKDEPRSIDFV